MQGLVPRTRVSVPVRRAPGRADGSTAPVPTFPAPDPAALDAGRGRLSPGAGAAAQMSGEGGGARPLLTQKPLGPACSVVGSGGFSPRGVRSLILVRLSSDRQTPIVITDLKTSDVAETGFLWKSCAACSLAGPAPSACYPVELTFGRGSRVPVFTPRN